MNRLINKTSLINTGIFNDKVALLLLAPLFASAVSAQTAPNIGDVMRQLPPAPPPTQQSTTPVPKIGGTEAIEAPMHALPNAGLKIVVKHFNIVGNREIDSATLLAQIKDSTEKSMSLADLEDVATQLTRFYRSRGYFVARVYLPQQEVSDGVITLRALEGNYGKFVLDNKSLVRDNIVQGMLDDVKKYDIVSVDTLERAMLIINDTPGAKVVRADVMPGEAIGTSDFVVGVQATPAQQGFILADNYGSRYTGTNRLSFNWDWNSPTHSGDRLSVSGLSSDNTDLLNGRIAYSLPLTASGWRGEIAISKTTYELGDDFKDLDAVGYSQGVDLSVTYPLRRITSQTIQTGLTYSYKDLKDEIRSTDTDTPKTLNSLTAFLNIRDERNLLGANGVTTGNLSVTTGDLDFRDRTAQDLDQAAGGPHTQGSYSRVNASLARVSLLPMNWSLTTAFQLQRKLNRNLDSSERMGVSGVTGVMAYPSGELSGSNADLLKIELAHPLPDIFGFQNQWSVFDDWGRAQPTDLEGYRHLSDIGIGWVAHHASGWLIKANLAHRLDDAPAQSESTPRNKFWIQAGYIF